MMENCYSDLEYNYKSIVEKIHNAAYKSNRDFKDITFLAATKTVLPEKINHAISLGMNCIGENRVQELLDKYEKYDLDNCDLQFIGQIQTNKIKFIADKVSQIQSVDTIKQVEIINKECIKINKNMNILVEVNVGNEDSKGGVVPQALYEFIDEARSFSNIRINGLMAIPPFSVNKTQLCKYFLNMKQYYVDITAKKLDNISMTCLSMGMSSDFETAIECGSTMVRIGSSLFGPRQY